MTWSLLFGAVAIFILLPTLSFIITLKVQKKN